MFSKYGSHQFWFLILEKYSYGYLKFSYVTAKRDNFEFEKQVFFLHFGFISSFNKLPIDF